ncbi:SWIM zinc finger family protein [Pseudoduganella lutea]|uniref:SWIM zinc finger family protein n=1 Tax=Pseudoduganella lutea TaxID=321985 RepID=A0A4P6L3U6_9BURK|nr:SWIM zinc finger family protein [Pseudoduganella lutea]QBE65518.1 SWIM zinc finger family protein [Pseudoduganella lutea]
MSPPWAALCRNFDDDALATLASTGLLRRAAKDVEAGKVAWDAPPSPAGGTFRVDGQLVAIGEKGPAGAACDCPAPGICKHVVAAVLWLRDQDVVPGGGDGEDNTAHDGPGDVVEAGQRMAAPDVLAEVLALDRAAVLKAAGRAAVRKAAALFPRAGPPACEASGGTLRITLPELDFECRYIGAGGLAGMVSEGVASSRKALHLLALAAVWQQHGHAAPWPAEAMPAAPATGPTAAEREFLAHADGSILEACGIGWSHLPDILPAQLRALGTSARIEAFPRLAGMLRELAGTAALLQRRDPHADEREAIGLAARIHALCTALDGATGEIPARLRGSERRTFSDGATLELLALGAHWWERRGGARGLAVPFWDPEGRTVVQAVLARRDGADRTFNAASSWSIGQLWQGVTCERALAAGAWSLRDARLSPDGRIGIGGATRAAALPPWAEDDPRWQAAGFDDWAELGAALRTGAGLESGPSYVLLRPASHETPQLHEARQVLAWPLRDRHDNQLVLQVPCDTARRVRIENLDAWTAAGSTDNIAGTVVGVVAAVEREAGAGWLEPVSLVFSRNGRLRAIALDFDTPPRAAQPNPGFLARLARLLRPLASLEPAATADPIPAARASAHAQRIGAVLAVLEHHCMTGRHAPTARERQQVDAARRFWLATGLDVLVRATDTWLAAPGAANALMLVHLCRTALELDSRFG